MERNTTMIRLFLAASVHIRYFLRRYMPTNVLIDAVRTRRRGLKWGIPATLLAVPYLLAANVCVQLIEDGGPSWLHLLVLLFVWDMFKMLWIGPISVILLIRARIREAVAARRTGPTLDTADGDVSHRILAGSAGRR